MSEESVKELRKIQATSGIIKSSPSEVTGFQYALGAWAADDHEQQAQIMTAPSLGGTLPVIDFCRGYAFVFFLKELTDDQKANVFGAVKEVLDGQFTANCK